MTGFASFFKKELMEITRSYKALILFLVFILFGFLSPALAKLLPEIISKISTGSNISISLPPSSYLDAYAQFFKNTTQMGLIVMLLLFATTLSSEISKGTLIMPLSKGLSRDAVILGKFTSSLLLWTVSFVLAAGIDIAYTYFLFGAAFAPNLVLSLFCLWLFGAFLLSLLLFSGCLVNGSFGGLLLSVGILFMLMMLNIVPAILPYSPLFLSSQNDALLATSVSASAMIPSIIVTCMLILLLTSGALALFRKKAL